MPQRPPATPALREERVGDWEVDAPLGRDRLGELVLAHDGDRAGRLRICANRRIDTTTLERLAGVRDDSVAPLLDHLVAGDGRVAVVTEPDALTLAERRRLGPIPVEVVVALGPALLEGLAALHAAGVAHGAVDLRAVGIDAEGRARWQDAGLSVARLPWALRTGTDVTTCAAMLRDLAALPSPLAGIVDAVAAGEAGSVRGAGDLARAWREAAAEVGLPVPPPGRTAIIPPLLGPVPASRRSLPPLPPGARRPLGAAFALAAAALLPLAALLDGPPLSSAQAYLAFRGGERLTYRVTDRQGGSAPLVLIETMIVTEVRIVAGVPTAVLRAAVVQGSDTARRLLLPGGTYTFAQGATRRTTVTGTARLLVDPLVPGATWTDRSPAGVGGIVTVEQRTVLGPAPLLEPAGHLSGCVELSTSSHVESVGGPGAAAAGLEWYCRGIGLARAQLVAGADEVEVDLMEVR